MIILVGASATGKSVVVKKMKDLFNVEKLVTYTTRPMRVGEVNDIDYHFITTLKQGAVPGDSPGSLLPA